MEDHAKIKITLEDLVSEKFEHMEKNAEHFEKRVESVKEKLLGLAEFAGISFGLFEIADVIKESFSEYSEALKAQREMTVLLNNTNHDVSLTSNNIVNMCKEVAEELAEPLYKVEGIASKLLNVKKLYNDKELFEKTLTLTHEMAYATGKDANTVAEGLIKFIQNPAMGRRFLAETGEMDEYTSKSIKSMVKSGKSMEAIEEVLEKLHQKYKDIDIDIEKEDPMFAIRKSMEELKDAVGPLAVDIIRKLSPTITELIEKTKKWIDSLTTEDIVNFIHYIKLAGEALVGLMIVEKITSIVGSLSKFGTFLTEFVGKFKGIFGLAGESAEGVAAMESVGGVASLSIPVLGEIVAGILTTTSVISIVKDFIKNINLEEDAKNPNYNKMNDIYEDLDVYNKTQKIPYSFFGDILKLEEGSPLKNFLSNVTDITSQDKMRFINELKNIEKGNTDYKKYDPYFENYNYKSIMDMIFNPATKGTYYYSKIIEFFNKAIEHNKDLYTHGSNTKLSSEPLISHTEESKVTGNKPVNIYITMDSMVKEMNIEAQTIDKSANEIEDIIIKCLEDALNTSQNIAMHN